MCLKERRRAFDILEYLVDGCNEEIQGEVRVQSGGGLVWSLPKKNHACWHDDTLGDVSEPRRANIGPLNTDNIQELGYHSKDKYFLPR